MDNNSLAHTKWNCKYHIVFTPKYRRQIIYKKISSDIGQIVRMLCARKMEIGISGAEDTMWIQWGVTKRR